MHTALHPESFLAHLLAEHPLVTSREAELPRRVALSPNALVPALIVAVDNGNDAFKGALMAAQSPRLVTVRIVTAYAPAKTIRAGEDRPAFRVNGSESFWIGEEAVGSPHCESLPIGTTTERLPDARFQSFFAACLVDLLREAGYAPGTYPLFLSLGIPNEELTLQGVRPEVSRTLRELFGTPFVVERSDEQGRCSTWRLSLAELIPYPQSFGTFATWYYTRDGRPIETTVVRHVTLDIGGGQFHDCEVDLDARSDGRVKLRMAASLLGEGTIALARAARETIRARYPGIQLSDAEAQQMLLTRQVVVGGHRTAVDELVVEVIAARAHNLFARMLPLVQEGRNFLLFTGGGAALLEEQLRAIVLPTRAAHQYLFVPRSLAPVLNAVGGYVLAQAQAQRLLAELRERPRLSAAQGG